MMAQARQTLGAIAVALGVGGAGYAALTEIPRTTVEEGPGLFLTTEGKEARPWYERSGTRYLFGDLKDGKYSSWDGASIEGHFKPREDGDHGYQLDGHGKRHDPHGSAFYDNRQQFLSEGIAIREEGEFKDNKLHGHGKRERMDGTIIEGEFVYGLPNGHATVIFKDGSKVVGEFKNGKPTSERNPLLDGQPIELKPGDSISFKFSSSPLQGLVRGKHTDAKGEVIFDGEVDEDQVMVNGFENLVMKGIGTYVGEVKDKMAHGKGKLTLKDGRTFEGTFDHGVLVGHNIFINIYDQKLYEGEMKDGKPNGEGTQTLWNGATQKGTFINGKLQHGKEVDGQGHISEGDFHENGKLVTGHITYNPNSLPDYDYDRQIVETDIQFGVPNGPGKIKANYTIISGWFENGKFSKRKPGEEIETGGPAEYTMTPGGQKVFRITQDTRAAFFYGFSGSCYWVPKGTVPTTGTIKVDPKKLPEEMQGEPNCGRSIPHPNLFDD